MSNVYQINIEFLAGSGIEDCCKEAFELAKKNRCRVQFNFNGIVLNTENHTAKSMEELYLVKIKK